MIIKRLITLVANTEDSSRVRQFLGLPPELTGGEDHRERLPWRRVLMIEQKPDGVFLFRFTADGTCCGDTWHLSVDDAIAQAESEYGGLLDSWKEVPEHIRDPIAFAVSMIRSAD